MILFHTLVILLLLIVAYDEYNSIMRLIYYFDILYQHNIVKIKMFLFKRKIENLISKDLESMNKKWKI